MLLVYKTVPASGFQKAFKRHYSASRCLNFSAVMLVVSKTRTRSWLSKRSLLLVLLVYRKNLTGLWLSKRTPLLACLFSRCHAAGVETPHRLVAFNRHCFVFFVKVMV